ncbi:hypothetical protein EG328_008762 [Venturia inaequalis]|uniref:Transmembrane protein n=1 Tax=Venturia inaequalis TaxID=5025 RepID=A0A8H3VMT6_VENIN|nr:hypothetical protein EG328_008762 [Venturia inaequalis]KAE9991715.1 hypothetical protein EG327_011076 [Venturia inaequalis]RDI84346.1 Cytosolic Fe-S cluster assembly factor [Venturia inaequalis]
MSRTLHHYKEPETPTRRYFVERPAALHLSPINTSSSFHSNSTTATSSSTASAKHAWSSTDRKGFSNQHSPSALFITKGENKSHPKLSDIRRPSHPIFSPPLLSARSSVFLAALQQSIFSAIDVYLQRRITNSPTPTLHHHTTASRHSDFTIASSKDKRKHLLSHTRKVGTAVCLALVITTITITAFLGSKTYSNQPRDGQHLIMVGSTTTIALIALTMLAAKRSVMEILEMAAVAFTICQCLQNDLSSPS